MLLQHACMLSDCQWFFSTVHVHTLTNPPTQEQLLSEHSGRGVALLLPNNMTLGSDATSTWPSSGLMLPQPTCLVGLGPATGLSLSYQQGLFVAPPGALDGHLVLKDLFIGKSPQGYQSTTGNNNSRGNSSSARRLHSTPSQHSRGWAAGQVGGSLARKLLHFPIGDMQPPYLPPEAFTLLMWSVRRWVCMIEAAVTLATRCI
jgi:hypothetical protein